MVTRQQVTLHDGRVVDSYSEEWRAECEARHVLNLPTKAERQAYLAGVADFRGANARARLENLILAIYRARRARENGDK